MAAPMGPSARDMRQSIVVQRRGTGSADFGDGTPGAWATIIGPIAAKLTPLTPRRADAEQVIAARLQGTAIWDCWLRYSDAVAGILVTDQVCDARGGQDPTTGAYLKTFNVRFGSDMDGRRQRYFLQLEQGVATG